MVFCRPFFIPSFVILTALSQGQTSSVRMAPLAKDPPRASLGATSLGVKPSSDVLHLAVSLNFRDPIGAQQFADSVSDPKSSNYRHFISPVEVGRRFGLAPSEVSMVTDYLKSQGMKIRLVGQNRLSILVDATVAQAESAFNTSIRRFTVTPERHTDTGERFAFTTSPEVPLNIFPDIIDISGLENFTRPKAKNLTPTQLLGLYSVAPMYKGGMQGQGRTVGISGWDGFRISNEQLQVQNFNLPVPAAGAGSNISVVSIDGGNGIEGYEYGEGDLDIQATIEIAPLCNLIIYDNDTPDGSASVIDVLTKEADDNSADVITESYGWFFDIPTALSAHNLHVSMNLQGITYLVASGDSGTSLGGYDYPVIDPEVMTVGGTSAQVNNLNLRSSEVGWNSFEGAGGGGWVASNDTFNIRAPYQLLPSFLANPGVPSASAVPFRLVPDIALNADPNTGYYVWFPSGSEIIGGTSGASPTCAGSLAVTEEQLIADGFLSTDFGGHQRFGRIQDLLYSYNGDHSVFFDIVSGTNGNLPNGNISKAGPGWDFDSGWGAVVFSGLVAKIEHLPQVGTLALSATAVNGGTPVTATVTLTAPASAGGTIVNLTSSMADVQVPSTVTIPANSTSATFQVTSNGVAAEEVANITASNAYGIQAVTLALFPATFNGLTLSPGFVAGGEPATGTVTLSGAAPPSGVTIMLSSNSNQAKVPATVTVPGNSTSATFTVTTTIGTTSASAIIIGESSDSTTKTATLAIQTATVQGVQLNASAVVGGSDAVVVGTVRLDGPAKKGGDVVKLVSSNPKLLTVPASVTIPSAGTSISFAVDHKMSSANGVATVTATYNGSSQTVSLNVNPFQVVSVTASPGFLSTGGTAAGLVTLNAKAGKGVSVEVKLSSSTKSVVVPASTSILSGASTGKFTVSCKASSENSSATITGTVGSSVQSTIVNLVPPQITGVTISPSTFSGSGSKHVTGVVTISGAAPAGGLVVTLNSSNSGAASVPTTIKIPVGKTSASFTVSHNGVSGSTPVTIMATIGGLSMATTITVTP